MEHISIDPKRITIIDFDANEEALKPWLSQGITFINDRVTQENLGTLREIRRGGKSYNRPGLEY